MKKYLLIGLMSLGLIGCGDEPTPEQVKHKQAMEVLRAQQAHEREMARIKAQQIQAANPISHTYVENEYETIQDSSGGSNSYAEPEYDYSYEASEPTYSSSAYSVKSAPTTQTSMESGYSGTDMLLAAGGAMAAGYAVSQLLDNGMRSYQDDKGVTHYADKNGKPVSKATYEEAKKTSKVTQVKEKLKATGTKAKELGKQGLDKTKQKYQDVKNSPKTKQLKDKATYQAKKAKVMVKKAVHKVKQKAKKKK